MMMMMMMMMMTMMMTMMMLRKWLKLEERKTPTVPDNGFCPQIKTKYPEETQLTGLDARMVQIRKERKY